MCQNSQGSFKNRVELREPEMKDGDVSVILKKVKIKDAGTYECYVRTKGNKRPFYLKTITLNVTDSGGGAGHTEDGGDNEERLGLIVALSVVTVLLVAAYVAVAVFMIYRKCNGLKKQIHQPPVNKEIDHELKDLTHEPKEKLKEEQEEDDKPPAETLMDVP
ncbi:hypothetical protein Q5P01_002982 [Channa striata]|uniref:Immunoglobulin V-set domain-containing protein n=1 Tax=Channa striata TaxID=64152 RepID=A0AA88T8M0_CHASR|nr:hypothetical protein Q5P01_002982 [Channa striata]